MTLSSTELCERTGASYRQLSHWTAVGYIPEAMWVWEGLGHRRLRAGAGSGFNRRYNQEAIRLTRALTLVTKVAVALLPYVAEQVAANRPHPEGDLVLLHHPDVPEVLVRVDLS